MLLTPFDEVGREAGAKMVEMFGYYLPWHYAHGHAAEHNGTRNAVSLCDLHYMANFSIEGPDASAYIQNIITNDNRNKNVGSIQYTAICDTDGNMIDDGTVWRLAEREYLLITGAEDDYEWLKKTAPGYNIELKNITANHTTLALQGPKSVAVLEKLTSFDIKKIRYYRFVVAEVAGVECLVARMGYTGEFGFELHFPASHARHMWTALMDAGASVGIVPCGQAALESLRQEAGYILVGNDHDRTTNPFEAGIGFAVKFDKSEFNGKAALKKISESGVDRRLVWLDLPSGTVASSGDEISVQGKRIGRVTSGSYSPSRRRGTALGYVTPGHAIPGLVATIVNNQGEHEAIIHDMALYDPGNVRSRTTPGS